MPEILDVDANVSENTTNGLSFSVVQNRFMRRNPPRRQGDSGQISICERFADRALDNNGVMIALSGPMARSLLNFILEADFDPNIAEDRALYALAERMANHYGFHLDENKQLSAGRPN